MPSATLTSKGQLTVPKEVRERLGLHPGDRVEFRIEKDGTARMVPATRKVADVARMLSAYAREKPVSVEEMHENIKRAFRKKKL